MIKKNAARQGRRGCVTFLSLNKLVDLAAGGIKQTLKYRSKDALEEINDLSEKAVYRQDAVENAVHADVQAGAGFLRYGCGFVDHVNYLRMIEWFYAAVLLYRLFPFL